MFDFKVEDGKLFLNLGHLAAGLKDATPLTRMLAGTLESETEKNFAAQGRPSWLGLKAPVSERRKGGMILQDTGQLAGSISTEYGPDFVRIGSNKPYARIHQEGGDVPAHIILPRHAKALAFNGRVVRRVKHPGSKIPARPYLPFDANGNLQPETETALRDDVLAYLRSLVSP